MKKRLVYLLCLVPYLLSAQETAQDISFAKHIYLQTQSSPSANLHIEVEDADYLHAVAKAGDWNVSESSRLQVTTIPSEGDDAKGFAHSWDGDFVMFKNVDFGEKTTKAIIRKEFPRSAKIELWIDCTVDEENGTMTDGTLIGTLVTTTPAAGTGWGKWGSYELDLTVPVSGVHNLVMAYHPGTGINTNQDFGGTNWIEFNGEVTTGLYRQATSRYASFSVNGIEVPVLDGATSDIKKDFLDYDVVRFCAGKGKAIARVQCTSPVSSISISPLKLGITPVKVDDYTYEFDVPDPEDVPYYIVATINGKRMVVARDVPVSAPDLTSDSVFNVKDELTLQGIDATIMGNAQAVASAFQQVMDKASEYGSTHENRGVVYVPEGIYYMGNLMLKSNTALYLDEDAVLRFSDNKEDYTDDFIKTSLWSDDSQGRHGTWWICTEEGADNVKIYGRGILDGNGYYLQKQGERNRLFCNHTLMIMQASHVEVDGITILQTAFWGTVLARSNDVRITNIKFMNSMDANENDCIDVCESQNVLVDRAIGFSLDDPFSSKTWAGTGMMINWYGDAEQQKNVIFDHCVSHTYCGGFKLGHGAMQLQDNIVVRNGVVIWSGRAIGIEAKYGNPNGEPVGGYANVLFENMDIEGASGEGWLKILADTPNLGNPPIQNVTLRNINIRSKGDPSTLKGCDEDNIVDGVLFDNVRPLGNEEPVSSLAELNILNTGFYKNVRFAQDKSQDEEYLIEAEYYNSKSGGSMTDNTGENADEEHTGGCIMTGIGNNHYLCYKNVDLGSRTQELILRLFPYYAIDKYTIEVRIDAADGTLIGCTDLLVENAKQWEDYTVTLDETAGGVHDLYIVFRSTHALYKTVGDLNYIRLAGRGFVNLEALVTENASVEVNIEQSTQLTVSRVPENAYQQDIVWSIVDAQPEACITLDKNGLVKGVATGKATVRATSLFDESIFADIEVNVVDKLTFSTTRLEAEDAGKLYDTYHFDSPINITVVNDPEEEGAQGIANTWHGNFAVYKDVDFEDGAVKALIRKGYPRGSIMQLWVDSDIDEDNMELNGGTLIGEMEFPATGSTDWTRWETFEMPLAEVKGVHDLCIVFLAGGGSATNQQYGSLNWIDFICIAKGTADGIKEQLHADFKAYAIKKGTLCIETPQATEVTVATMDGKVIEHFVTKGGIHTLTGLSKGVYIVNRTKVIVR